MFKKSTLLCFLIVIFFGYGWTSTHQSNLEESFTYGTSTPNSGDRCGPKISSLLDKGLKASREKKPAHIKIYLYSLTRVDFIQKLGEIARQGGTVEILLDKKQYETSKSKPALETINRYNNVALKVLGTNVKNFYDCITLHEKVGIFHIEDEIYVFTGSYNWTHLAQRKNYENCLEMKVTSTHTQVRYMVDNFLQRFGVLWAEGVLIPKGGSSGGRTPGAAAPVSRGASAVVQLPTPSPVAGRTRTGISRRQQPATDDTA